MKKQPRNENSNIFRLFEFVMEVIGWLQIVASPLFIGLAIGLLIYIPQPSLTRLIIGAVFTVAGLILGIKLATKKWKGKGTVDFISRISATPDLDNIEPENKSKETERDHL